jgi:hypothetical protein
MAVKTAKAFFTFIEKSKLLSEEELDEARIWCDEKRSPKEVARELIDKQWVTTWQARQLLVGGYLLTLGKYKLLNLYC